MYISGNSSDLCLVVMITLYSADHLPSSLETVSNPVTMNPPTIEKQPAIKFWKRKLIIVCVCVITLVLSLSVISYLASRSTKPVHVALMERLNYEPVTNQNSTIWHLKSTDLFERHPTWNFDQWTMVWTLFKQIDVHQGTQVNQHIALFEVCKQAFRLADRYHPSSYAGVRFRNSCSTIFEAVSSLGGIPTPLCDTARNNKVFGRVVLNNNNLNWKVCQSTCKTCEQMLHHWSTLAVKKRILWWLVRDSLFRIGQVFLDKRELNIAILDSAENLIRNISTPHGKIREGEFNLVTRLGEQCTKEHSSLMDCKGNIVQRPTDECSFCQPFARLFKRFGERINIYLVHVELRLDSSNNPVEIGYSDESLVGIVEGRSLYDLRLLFPIRSCDIMELSATCPQRIAEVIQLYDGNPEITTRPSCDRYTGKWKE